MVTEAYVRNAEIEDAYELSGKLRAEDLNELIIAGNVKPLEALLGGFGGKNTQIYSIINEDKVVGMFGVGDCPFLPNYGVVWLLGSSEIDSIGRQFLKECRIWIRKMQDRYDVIYNWVYPENWKSLKWLQFCGFEIRAKKPYGIQNEEFYLMIREKQNV
tara:strand:- start:7406 stop:7882 length:477 start_codon:yes stop_codon:yes gene_type:complete